MSKENNIKEKFKIALVSTEKAISDDLLKKDPKNKKNIKDLNQIILKIMHVNRFMNFQKKLDVNCLVQKCLKVQK